MGRSRLKPLFKVTFGRTEEDRPEDKGGNKVAVTAGTFEDAFPWLTVHLYKAAMPE